MCVVPTTSEAARALCMLLLLLLNQGEQLLVPPPFFWGCQKVSCGASSLWDGAGAGCIPLQWDLVENLFYDLK